MKLPANTKYLFEITAIFIGITLSLLVDEWRENKQNREETVKALKMIRGDLVADTATLGFAQRYTNYYSYLIDFQLNNLNKINDADSLYNLFTVSGHYEISEYKINGNSIFQNLQNPEINNDSVSILISEYYGEKSLIFMHEQLMKFSWETLASEMRNHEWRYILSKVKFEKTDSMSEFMIDQYRTNIEDSQYFTENIYRDAVNEMKLFMMTKTYRTLIYERRVILNNLGFYANIKNNIAIQLISLIDEELEE